MPAVDTIVLPPLTGPQIAILEVADRNVMIEGSPRSAKSWGVAFKIWKLALAHPGIQIFYSRYQEQSLVTNRDIWSKVGVFFPPYLQPAWNANEGSWDFANAPAEAPVPPAGAHYGSRVYLSSIKSADVNNVHSKYKGKTLAVVVVEEASEVPHVNYRGLKERLSQGRTPWGTPYEYPLQILLVTNCIDEDHYLADEFPVTNTKPGYRHLRADLYSNQHNLGPTVMAGYEADYPEGSPLRRTVIEGKRGVSLTGIPVYKGYYRRETHVSATPLAFNPYYPLLEGWDFGQEKPAVVWAQYISHLAALRIVGAVKGAELFLETFAPLVLAVRRRLFPHATSIRSWCDPTGVTGNGGLEYTPITLLHQLGVPAKPAKDDASSRDGNDLEVRNKAIQTVGGYMARVGTDGLPAFLVGPTCLEIKRDDLTGALVEQDSAVLTTAFEAGYVWDGKAASDAHPNIRRPKKGTRYDDLMNALEYIVVGERIPLAPTVSQLATAAAAYQSAPQRAQLQQQIADRLALRTAQTDTHPLDAPTRPRAGGPLGGFGLRRPR